MQGKQRLQYKIALDDIGTGFKSLTHLLTMRVNIIKIDRGFIDHLGVNDASTDMVKGTLPIARRAGIKVVAEGLEHRQQEHLLLEQGCLLGQGYLYAKPLPAEKAAKVLMEKGQTIKPQRRGK